jgi:hypothetical protein
MTASIQDPHPESEFAKVSVFHADFVVPGVFEKLARSVSLLFKFQVVDGVEEDRDTSKYDVEELENDRFEKNLSRESVVEGKPELREYKDEILVESVNYEVRVSTIVFTAVEKH